MNFSELFMGTPSQDKQFTKLLPEQTNMLMQLIQGLQGGDSNIQGMDYLKSLFSNDPEAFSAYEAPMLRQFNEQIVPGIAERFSGMGSGSRNSSAFQNQIAGAGARLSENLGAQRANLRQGGLNSIMSLLQGSMQPTFENVHMQGQPGLFQNLAGGFGQGFGMMLPKLFGF